MIMIINAVLFMLCTFALEVSVSFFGIRKLITAPGNCRNTSQLTQAQNAALISVGFRLFFWSRQDQA